MRDLLYRLARMRMVSSLIRLLLANFSFALPVKRLRETDTLMAFFHPTPSHKLHILIVPKMRYETVFDIPPGGDGFTDDLFETVKYLIKQFDLESGSYRLILNGGDYQEISHLHFHLISDEDR
jgi:histidine triad (HIT) family protein